MRLHNLDLWRICVFALDPFGKVRFGSGRGRVRNMFNGFTLADLSSQYLASNIDSEAAE